MKIGPSLALLVLFVGIGLTIYRPALEGAFVSDDAHYVENNAYVHQFDVAAIVDPTGPLGSVTENYAPLHLLLHALQWQVFGADVRGYHVTNVVLHALAAVLLVGLFMRFGIARELAVVGGSLFLLHPANVEAVAWISQLKSTAALVLVLGALLAHPRRPALGLVLYALALLAKPLAAFGLPVAVLWGWCELRGGSDAAAWRWGWLAVWGVVLVAFSVAELGIWQGTAGGASFLYPEVDLRLRTSLAIAARYVWLSLTGLGASTWHEPAPAQSWLDPWWLGGLVLFVGLGVRAGIALWRGRPDGVLLAWALMAWVPICGAFLPLSFPMADRYLYFILPGLLGAALCWVAPLGRALAAHGPVPSAWLARAGAVGALGLGLAFASQSYARARVWRSPATQMADAIRHYPDGIAATLMGARRAAQSGDADTAVALLRRARDRGYMRLSQLVGDPAFARMAQEPAFRALLADMAQGLIDTWDRPGASQPELYQVAYAHLVRGEKALAAAALERALEVGGPRDEEIRHDLARLRRELDRAAGDR